MWFRLMAGLVLAGFVLSPVSALAHGGEDHSAPPVVAIQAVQPGFAADGTAFQAVLVPEDDGHVLVYLADADSNAPVGGARIDSEAAGWSGTAQPTAGTGIYRLSWSLPATPVDMTLMVSANGRDDLLLLAGLARPAVIEAPAVAEPHWRHWWGGALLGGLASLILVLVLRRKRLALLALLVASGPAFAHSGHDHAEPAAAPAPVVGASVSMAKSTQFLLGIRTERVAAREAAQTVRVPGRVMPDPAGFARVQPSQPARVVADAAFPLPVPGQQVKRGQVVAVLEPTLSTLERGEKRASLYRVEGEIVLAERELARQEALGTIVTAKAVETSRIRLEQLRRERTQIAVTQLGRELVTAPVDGVIADVHVVPGEVVAVDKVMVEIVDPARLRVEAVTHDPAVAARIGAAEATTRLVPNHAFPLDLLGVSPKVDSVDQGIHALFAVRPGHGDGLKVGMPVDVHLAVGATRLRMAVPRDALAEMAGRSVVFVLTAPETFEARPVKVERLIGPLAEIDGVKPGERVVVQGAAQLKSAR
ncbi:Membrane-fusion protein [Magnetospirillum sp. LM-5]|uniref:efflux RND transporter periplasmic adaptor subunit n=1 Tax=Magnetospirillum sp. LM-5 TaxID=2681466 RepID=UPI00138480D0|nr:efflux RND transporter periplasmic adaptor subunit [Magnetospirillum sp. LM-5]CAA7612610.1 Membrane-fusion protein [Magnetospirillum sp. LM-5]